MTHFFEKLLDVETVDIRKRINGMISEARKKAKPDKCILCGKSQTSFCKSHSVPQMALRPIAENGIVMHAWAIFGINEKMLLCQDLAQIKMRGSAS